MVISLDKQIFIYSVSTDAFYNDNEMKIHRKLNKSYNFRKALKKERSKLKKEDAVRDEKIKKHLKSTNIRVQKLKSKLYNELSSKENTRYLNPRYLNNRNIISVFDSVLSRTLEIEENELSEDIIVVQTYFFDVLEDIILNGFIHKDEKYICFTASAGQIRTKKTVFIKEKVWMEHRESLTCGLTVERINEQGGVNINKYLAYLALCNSATDDWTDFNIDKVVVVDDMESPVQSVVDFIDDKTYEITRKEMDILITHTDGCGMILPRKSKKSFMLRMPWIKGLLVPFPFDKFIREANKDSKDKKYGVITDIYGKQHNLIDDDIEIILTKSQFKMWKYYSSWEEYKNYYKRFKSQAGICNLEEDVIRNAKINYQMIQTLTDFSDEELETLCNLTNSHIHNIGKDRFTMLKILGVTNSNTEKNYLQQALEIYPELLSDRYAREILKQVKKSMVKEARAGKIEIDGKYTFICPDLYAFCEKLILSHKQPKGLLNNGEVYCSIFKNVDKLNCLRSPHLYREHAIRNNVVDSKKSKWFITKGIYTSCHDPISKILMFDNDGDKALVCSDPTLIRVAERNMEDIVPLQYEMAKAEAEQINNQSIYNGLKAAYSGGNIGEISNNITKIWNSGNINYEVIKLLCMENNFVIDYAKTLYKPKRPKEKGRLISSYTKAKVPHFFIYAKDKNIENVEAVNNSTVNKLKKIVRNPIISFKSANLGDLNYRMLLSNKEKVVNLDDDIISRYLHLETKSHFIINRNSGDTNNIRYVYFTIREDLLRINGDETYVVDTLVEYLYNHKKASFKTTLWECFGNVLVENLKHNTQCEFGNKTMQCDSCGTRLEATSNNKKYCDSCAGLSRKAYKARKEREYRKKRGQVKNL